MTISNDVLSEKLSSSTGFNGIWKAQSDQKNNSFEKILTDSIDKYQKDSKSGVYSIRPNLSSDTVSGMVKGFAEKNNISEAGKVTSKALSDEQNMIMTTANSSLYTRDVYSKLISQLQNQSWDYKNTHYTKI